MVLEVLEDRCLPSFTLGTLVQAAPTDLFAACKPGNQMGTFFPDTQVEPLLAVDPTNLNHMVGAWQQERWDNGGSFGIAAAVTFDAGLHWTQVVIPGISTCSGGPFDRASDPWVSFGPTGTVYVASLGIDGNVNAETASAILVNRSTDGGLTWSQPVTLIQSGKGFLNDKEAITADPHNPNLVYVIWDQPRGLSSNGLGQTFFSRSTDSGQTWSIPQLIFQSPTNGSSIGHQILVLPNGTLVDAFDEIQFNPTTFITTFSLDVLRSTDGGLTWSQPIVGPQQMPLFVIDPFNLFSVRSGGNLPEVAVDPTSGNLYAVWEDGRFSNNQFESVAFSMSTDGGLTWSSPIQINQTPVNSSAPVDSQAFTPSVAVGANGAVAVTYYDFRFGDAIAGAGTDSWAVFGNPGGSGGLTNPANWGNELRLTGTSFNILNAPNAFGWFLGDYEGLAAAGNNFEAFFSQAGAPFPQAHIFARQIVIGPVGPPTPTPASAPVPTVVTLQPTAPAPPTGFLAPVGYATDQGPRAVAVGDFNNDTNPDIVTANITVNDDSILLGNANGTFQPQMKNGVGKSPVGVAVGDFNHDGNLDIATANEGSFTSNANSTSFPGFLAVSLGKGNGTFPNTTTYVLPNVIANQVQQFPSSDSIAVGDLNNDGNLDVVMTVDDEEGHGYVNVFLGQGDGTFKELAPFAINSASPDSIALADINGDGKLDLVTSGNRRLSILLGNGDGTFQEVIDPVVGTGVAGFEGVSNVAVGEFDKDSRPDIAVTGRFFTSVNGTFQSGSVVSVLSGTNKGTFQPSQTIVLTGHAIIAMALADLNRDGKLDVVTANFTTNFPNPGTVSVFLGNGDGTLQAPLNFSSGAVIPEGVAVGDFNHDGFPDLAIPDFHTNTVQVLINSGSWPALTTTTAAPALAASANPAAMTAGLLTMWTGLAPVTNASGSSAASQSSPESAPAHSDDRSSAVVFGANTTAVEQFFASLAAENQTALWSGTQPLDLDGWVGRATDPFLDPFKVG
jgi:hypothetical protein